MTDDDDRSAHAVAKGIGAFVLAVIVVNVLLRVVPLPDVDLRSIALPDLPAWLGPLLKVKNWLMGGVVVVVVVGAVVDWLDKQRKRARADGEDQPR